MLNTTQLVQLSWCIKQNRDIINIIYSSTLLSLFIYIFRNKFDWKSVHQFQIGFFKDKNQQKHVGFFELFRAFHGRIQLPNLFGLSSLGLFKFDDLAGDTNHNHYMHNIIKNKLERLLKLGGVQHAKERFEGARVGLSFFN